jgi:CRP-like cAMP-binding protein
VVVEQTLWDIGPGNRSPPVIKELMKLVSDLKFFKDLPHDVIEQLCGYMRRVTYQKQHFVFEAEDMGPFKFYVVRRGIVSIIVRKRPSPGVVKETTVARLHSGDAFGEGTWAYLFLHGCDVC